MRKHIASNLWLLGLTVVLCCVLYPLVLWAFGQLLFPNQAEGSLIDETGQPTTDPARARGSLLIGQPFNGDEYFQPRPSNAGNGYDATQSGASNWGASNPALRGRVAVALGPIARYQDAKDNPPVGPDIETWLQEKQIRLRNERKPGIVALWAQTYPTTAQAWVKSSDDTKAYVAEWMKKHPEELKKWKETPGNTGAPKPEDLAGPFWESYAGEDDSALWPGPLSLFVATFPSMTQDPGESKKTMKRVMAGTDIQGYVFDMWLQEHPQAKLLPVPADMVMSSGSGLDPHITLDNARYQLKYRIAAARALLILDTDAEVRKLKEAAANEKDESKRTQREEQRDQARDAVRKIIEDRLGKRLEEKITEVIEKILDQKKHAPLGGLAGVDLVNVVEVNLTMQTALTELNEEIK